MTPSAVYRFYDASGKLLYVGVTNNPRRRFEEHAETKSWWSDVDDIQVEWFNARFEADAAESVAIWQEQPRYNIVDPIRFGNRPQPGPRAAEPVVLLDAMEMFFDKLAEELK